MTIVVLSGVRVNIKLERFSKRLNRDWEQNMCLNIKYI